MWEPLASWHHFAKAARGLLGIAAALHLGQDVEPDHWKAVFSARLATASDERESENLDRYILAASEDRQVCCSAINNVMSQWFDWGNVRPEVRWSTESAEPSFRLGGGTFGLLTVQLAIAMSRAQTLCTCSGCGHIYIRHDRMPQRGRRNYCPICVETKVPIRDAKRDYRRRGRSKDG